ncbi:sugar phosphate isomerase/epimerase family protein [Haladaptatus caseinilyticus]|uniref:sugar phosphate isomerase/epimerase family protein n=1 Tax=Haladaptatus caseinilyticus TaxID=2993314 RepID=UPI00224B6DD1|nr:sugar phosphate isomerase/epimerase [Haladaptatus caseinilyticus]
MGIGYTTILYDEESLSHGIGDIGACQYDGIEIGLEKVRAVGYKTVRDVLRKNELDPYLIMGEWLESDAACDRVVDGAYTASRLDAEFIGILPPQRGHVDDKILDEWITQICEAAYDAGVTPLLHHHGATHIEQPDEIAAWLKRSPSNLKLVWDTAHHYPYGRHYPSGDVTDGIERFADDIEYVHLKDVAPPADFDSHIEALSNAEFHLDNVINYFRAFTDLGEGRLDFGAVADTLDNIGFDGHITIEIENQTTDPLIHAKKNLDYWQDVTND